MDKSEKTLFLTPKEMHYTKIYDYGEEDYTQLVTCEHINKDMQIDGPVEIYRKTLTPHSKYSYYLHSSGIIRNNMREGKWHEYTPENSPSVFVAADRAVAHNGDFCGKFIFSHTRPTGEVIYENGMRTGTSRLYDPHTGDLIKTIPFHNDKESGLVRTYYPEKQYNVALKSELMFRDGKPCGLEREYTPRGQLKSVVAHDADGHVMNDATFDLNSFLSLLRLFDQTKKILGADKRRTAKRNMDQLELLEVRHPKYFEKMGL